VDQSDTAAPARWRAVLFDFDGTLIDSYPAITASVNFVRAAHGLPPLAEEEVRRHVGRGAAYLMEHTVGPESVAADLARYRAHHPTVMVAGTHLLPGAREAITGLKKSGRRVGLCSNKPRAFSLELLNHMDLLAAFDVVLGPEDVPHPKPAPDLLLLAMQRLAVPATETLYVGDMTVDIQTARAAGVSVWVVPTGSDTEAALRQAGPDRLLHDLGDLTALLSTSP
jgi:phosphoglycolate phosphatase